MPTVSFVLCILWPHSHYNDVSEVCARVMIRASTAIHSVGVAFLDA